jgi:uncharacterized membrane protein YeaQ/YmgE (transglycosylase-associated protein family)
MGIVWTLVVGAIAGWLAGQIMKGRGFGLFGNIVVGIVGAILGDYLFRLADISIGSGTVSAIVTALIGALVLLFLVGLVKKA